MRRKIALAFIIIVNAFVLRSVFAQNPEIISPDNAHRVVPISTLLGHTSTVNSLAFNSDGTLLVSGSDDGTVRLWDVESGDMLYVWDDSDDSIEAVAFDPNGEFIVAGGREKILYIWETDTYELYVTVESPVDTIRDIDINQNGSAVVAVGLSGEIAMWRLKPFAQTALISLDFSPAIWSTEFLFGDMGIATGHGGFIKTWSLSDNVINVAQFDDNPQNVLDLSVGSKSNILAAAVEFQGVYLWNLDTGEQLLSSEKQYVESIDINPEDNILAIGDGYRVLLWDIATGEELLNSKFHDGIIHQLIFAPQGDKIASASSDRKIIIWGISQANG